MDFSSVLKKEIDLKRKNAWLSLAQQRPRLAEKSAAFCVPSSTEDSSPSSSTTHEKRQPKPLVDKSLENLSLSIEKVSEDVSNAVDSTGSASSTASVDKVTPSTTDEDPGGKKKKSYEEYLQKENTVDIFIGSQDILDQCMPKLALQIRKFVKEMLYTWSDNIDEQYPSAVLLETKRDLVKLLYKLRSGKLDPDVVVSLGTIVHYIQTEQLTMANEAYLKLSIGNVAWPIGVRDVGIHARAADAKIAGDDKLKLANIMKSESTRRWLVAVKRLINYSEKLLKT